MSVYLCSSGQKKSLAGGWNLRTGPLGSTGMPPRSLSLPSRGHTPPNRPPGKPVLRLSPGSGTTAEWAEVVFDPSPPCRFPSLLLPSYGSVIFFFTLAFNKDISPWVLAQPGLRAHVPSDLADSFVQAALTFWKTPWPTYRCLSQRGPKRGWQVGASPAS